MILKVLATDASGNTGISDPVIVNVSNAGGTIDTTAPKVAIGTPASGETVEGVSVLIGVTVRDDVGVASVGFLVDGVLIDTDKSAPYSTKWNTRDAVNGLHELTATASDLSGNTAISLPVKVRVSNGSPDTDTVPPKITIGTPSSGTTVSGGPVIIGATATDDVAVARVRFLVDGELIDTDTSEPYSTDWDTTSVPNGFHELIALATDTSGNMSISDPVIVRVANGVGKTDTSAPTVFLVSPTADATIAGKSVLIAAVVEDDVGVAGVRFLVDGTDIGTATKAPYFIRWNATTVSDGVHSLSAVATDLAGNVTTSAAIKVIVANGAGDTDTTPPEVRITTPASGQTVSGKSVPITVTATDDHGVATVRFLVDSTLIATDTSAPFSTDWNTTHVTNGLHELRAVATDTSGNTSISDPITVTVSNAGGEADTTPPKVFVVAPVGDSTVSGTTLIGVTAEDNEGVAGVQFLVDGVVIGDDSNSPYFISWDTTTFSDGPHPLGAIATDFSGNVAFSPLVTVTVSNASTDTTPPTVSIGTPADGATLSGTSNNKVLIGVTVTDDVGITTVEFQVDGVTIGTDTISPYSIVWDATRVTNGEHKLTAVATDTSGNTAKSTITVTVSN